MVKGCHIEAPPELIAVGRPPAADEVTVSTRVLVHWERGKFYPGTVTRIES